MLPLFQSGKAVRPFRSRDQPLPRYVADNDRAPIFRNNIMIRFKTMEALSLSLSLRSLGEGAHGAIPNSP